MDKKIILFAIFVVALLIIVLMSVLDNNTYYENEKSIIGKITYITKKDDKTTIDVKEKQKYRITIYESVDFKYGDKVKVTGLFKTPSDNTVFNLFNYRKYLLSKNIKEICTDCEVKRVRKTKNIFYIIKNKIVEHINNYKSKDYLKAFVIGDTSLISDDAKDAYSNIGISHLLAISGTHVSMFLVIINFLFKKSRLKNFILFSFLFFFLFITGFVESLIRCVLFMMLSFVNKKFKLKLNSINLIILTASILFIINPYLVYSVGLMFSLVITFFIILISDKLKNKSYVNKTFIISLIGFLSSVPILAYNFFKINVLSILFNIIFVPLVSFFIFPLSLITFIIPLFDDLFYMVANAFEGITLFLDNFKMLSFVIAKPNIIVIFIYYLMLYLSIKVNKKWIIFYLIILIININAKFLITNPTITFLDVGQGDSTLIILPKGNTILVDTGGNFFSNSSISLNKTIPYLNSLGINKIDLLILTHGDYDHMGDATYLVDNISVEKVIFNNGEYSEIELELISLLKKKKINYYKNIKVLNVDNNKFYFLNNSIYDDENDNSIVLYAKFNNTKLLLMGDATKKVEEDILNSYNINNIDILKVGHHGSRTSTSNDFINVIKPKHSIISVGKNNRYGHPNDEVLKVLSSSNIYRTDLNGSIMFEIKNSKLKIKTCIKRKEGK